MASFLLQFMGLDALGVSVPGAGLFTAPVVAFQKDKDLDYKIRQYQTQILLDKGIHNTNVDEYKFIGLAHRKYRRIWLNIDDAIEMCDRKYRRYKIVCLKVDVEEAKTSEEQFLMHRSLHGE